MNNWIKYFIVFSLWFGLLQVSIESKSYFFVFLLLSPFIFLFLREVWRGWKTSELATEQARLEKETIDEQTRLEIEMKNLCKQAIDLYGGTLQRKYKQASWFDDYGVRQTEKGDAEIKYFMKNVLYINQDDLLYHLAFDFIQNEINTTDTNEDYDIAENAVDAMDPLEFENHCARVLTKHGWKAYATKGSGDQGTDVIAEKDGVRAVLQCKLYSNPVGNKAVQEVNAGKTFEQAKIACGVTDSTYTKSARQLAQATGVLLLHHDDLPKLSTYIQALTQA